MSSTTTVDRVPRHTSEEINRRIRKQTETRVLHYGKNPTKIDGRLRLLDEEWDIERALETNASALAFTGLALGAMRDQRWLALPALVTAFLFQHAVQGWCPPVPIFRRLGYRTSHEIEEERYALKALRGDFGSISHADDPEIRASYALHAARL